ncbi:BppU family phage baseplate upper protein [Bacillus pacificus]|uniref:BppU family phage baseplate upper protein n=1 Tax=Bacillus pacificus TaxID=2026187 RepID=UPI002E216731|nr:BppU family phage baseplate upper protein [Bacillus pacificus]
MKTRLILDINKTQYAQLNAVVTGRQGDKETVTVNVFIVDSGVPYNLTGSDVYFECAKPDNTSVRDKNGIVMIDAAKGHFEYTFPAQTFAAIGKSKQAYFTVEKNSTVKATTQDFIIVSIPDALTNRIPSQTYISQLEELIWQLEQIELDLLNSEAYKEAHDAKEFAEQAKTLSESVKAQLDQIVIQGSIDPETKQARVDENGVAFPLLKDRIDNVGNRLFKIENKVNNTFVSVTEFGAIGNGTDETVKIQNAIDYCAAKKRILVFPSLDTYGVTSLRIKQGVVGLQSFGATLKALSNSGEGLFTGSLSTPVNDYFIDGFKIDCNGVSRRGIFARGSRIRITNNEIFGLNNPTVSECAIRFYHDSDFNLVEGNRIIMDVDIPFAKYAVLAGIYFTGNIPNVYAGLDTSNDVIPATLVCNNNTIRNNYVYGGTHGIQLTGADYNHISENKCEMQSHRSIILSPLANHNDIHNNNCLNFGSAGVHLAYGSSNNKISDNNIYSDGSMQIASSGGEGAIQAYIHCRENNIVGNKIYTRSTRHGIYVAIYCSGTNVQGNEIDVNTRCGISIESDWDVANSVYGVVNINPPVNPNWTTWGNKRTCNDITIKDNVIHKNTPGIANCGINIGQAHDTPMSNVHITGNIINSRNSSGHDIYIYVADPALYTNSTLTNNTVSPVDMVAIKFVNTAMKFTTYKNNNWQDRLLTISDTPSNTLDVSVSNNFILNAAVTIEKFSGTLVDVNMLGGREYTLKLFSGATIVHNNTDIRLKGNANIVATSGNQFVTFKQYANIMYEVSRSF